VIVKPKPTYTCKGCPYGVCVTVSVGRGLAPAVVLYGTKMFAGLSLLCKGRWVAERQLGGILILILYDFVKIPQSFFVLPKK